MWYRSIIISALALARCDAPATAANPVFPDRGRAAVVDAAHVLSPSAAAALNARVATWDNATGHQLAIVTIPSLQGDDIADYGYRLGRAWGLGRKGINDGALLIIAPVEHRVRIEVGRGLEGDLTDAETSVMLHDTVVPKLKAGDIVGAANAGVDAIMAAVPAGAGDVANAPKPAGSGVLGIVLMILGGLSVVSVLITARRKHREMKRAAKAERDRPAPPSRSIPQPPPSLRPAGNPFRPYPSYRDQPPSPTIIAPVIVNETSCSPSPSYSSDSSSSWGSSDSGSSSSSDFGSSSSGFDSGGGDFGGGGSDSSW